jgi:hypothetical protein
VGLGPPSELYSYVRRFEKRCHWKRSRRWSRGIRSTRFARSGQACGYNGCAGDLRVFVSSCLRCGRLGGSICVICGQLALGGRTGKPQASSPNGWVGGSSIQHRAGGWVAGWANPVSSIGYELTVYRQFACRCWLSAERRSQTSRYPGAAAAISPKILAAWSISPKAS